MFQKNIIYKIVTRDFILQNVEAVEKKHFFVSQLRTPDDDLTYKLCVDR